MLTFRLDLLQVGRDDDALDFAQFQVLEHFANAKHESAFALGFDLILLQLALIKAIQLGQDERRQLVNLLVNHLITVLAEAA